MPKRLRILLPILLLGATFARPAAADPLVMQGEAQRGETLIQQFKHGGHNYEFRLVPMGYGWSVWIGDPVYRDHNFVAVATPPYRGINPSVIQGWHFRNADNTGPNKAGEGNINAPGRERDMAFVLDSAGYQAAREAMAVLMQPTGKTEAEIDAAERRLKAVPRATAVMNIQALELGNLAKGQKAWIERMAFRLQISFP
jgi:hypothetical protein